jgi:hypothetical protein
MLEKGNLVKYAGDKTDEILGIVSHITNDSHYNIAVQTIYGNLIHYAAREIELISSLSDEDIL